MAGNPKLSGFPFFNGSEINIAKFTILTEAISNVGVLVISVERDTFVF